MLYQVLVTTLNAPQWRFGIQTTNAVRTIEYLRKLYKIRRRQRSNGVPENDLRMWTVITP